jgi:hypothetical protein
MKGIFSRSHLVRHARVAASVALLSTLAGCQTEELLCCSPPTPNPALRIVNAFPGPVDVLIDGSVVLGSLPAGYIYSTQPTQGAHTVALRSSGGTATVSESVTTSEGVLNTIAAVRAPNGVLATAVLDDTGSVVPAGATKVRVLHLAPSAGELQVYRTQPDFQQPVSWQFPFTYQAQPDALSAPFYQSTVGTWEIRVWQTPADASGWSTATVKAVIPLASGEKRTVLILDNPAGGIRLEII